MKLQANRKKVTASSTPNPSNICPRSGLAAEILTNTTTIRSRLKSVPTLLEWAHNFSVSGRPPAEFHLFFPESPAEEAVRFTMLVR